MIFMGCQMPQFDGYQATGEIRALETDTKLHPLCKRAETHFEDAEPKKFEMLGAMQAETRRMETFFNG